MWATVPAATESLDVGVCSSSHPLRYCDRGLWWSRMSVRESSSAWLFEVPICVLLFLSCRYRVLDLEN